MPILPTAHCRLWAGVCQYVKCTRSMNALHSGSSCDRQRRLAVLLALRLDKFVFQTVVAAVFPLPSEKRQIERIVLALALLHLLAVVQSFLSLQLVVEHSLQLGMSR